MLNGKPLCHAYHNLQRVAPLPARRFRQALTQATPQVVLQIERMSQSSLLKHYEEKNAALRRELKAQGASMHRHVSEIDAIRFLLHEARAEIVQHKEEQAQLLAIQRRLQGHLQGMVGWKAVVGPSQERLKVKALVMETLWYHAHAGRWRRRTAAVVFCRRFDAMLASVLGYWRRLHKRGDQVRKAQARRRAQCCGLALCAWRGASDAAASCHRLQGVVAAQAARRRRRRVLSRVLGRWASVTQEAAWCRCKQRQRAVDRAFHSWLVVRHRAAGALRCATRLGFRRKRWALQQLEAFLATRRWERSCTGAVVLGHFRRVVRVWRGAAEMRQRCRQQGSAAARIMHSSAAELRRAVFAALLRRKLHRAAARKMLVRRGFREKRLALHEWFRVRCMRSRSCRVCARSRLRRFKAGWWEAVEDGRRTARGLRMAWSWHGMHVLRRALRTWHAQLLSRGKQRRLLVSCTANLLRLVVSDWARAARRCKEEARAARSAQALAGALAGARDRAVGQLQRFSRRLRLAAICHGWRAWGAREALVGSNVMRHVVRQRLCNILGEWYSRTRWLSQVRAMIAAASVGVHASDGGSVVRSVHSRLLLPGLMPSRSLAELSEARTGAGDHGCWRIVATTAPAMVGWQASQCRQRFLRRSLMGFSLQCRLRRRRQCKARTVAQVGGSIICSAALAPGLLHRLRRLRSALRDCAAWSEPERLFPHGMLLVTDKVVLDFASCLQRVGALRVCLPGGLGTRRQLYRQRWLSQLCGRRHA